VKYQESPFKSDNPDNNLHWGKANFIPYPVEGCPVSVYLDTEMQTLVEKAMIDMEKMGMYKFLTLTY